MLERVCELKDELQQFLRAQSKDAWADIMNNEEWTVKPLYLIDIFEKLNKLNTSMQGYDTNMMGLFEKMVGFLVLCNYD